MTIATIGKRFQVVIPSRERKRLGLKPHSKVDVEVQDRDLVIHPLDAKGWRGIGTDMKDGSDATDYVRKLRMEWDSRS
jgi:AbrB family looped-hinge helix DNA binding protein